MPLTFQIDFYDIAFFGAVIISLTLSLLLWIVPRENQPANRWLAVLMTVVALWIIQLLAADINLAKYVLLWNRLPLRFSLAIGPLLFYSKIHCDLTVFEKDLMHVRLARK